MNINEATDAKRRGASKDLPSQQLTPEDEAALDADGEATPAHAKGLPSDEESAQAMREREDLEPPQTEGVPAWVVVPTNFRWPKKTKQVYFVRFRAELTETPEKGERQAILFGLNEADEKIARKRAAGDRDKTIPELTKQMLRAVDGESVDWMAKFGKGNPVTFWKEIGYVARQQLQAIFLKTHQFTPEQQSDFFTNCVAVMSVGG